MCLRMGVSVHPDGLRGMWDGGEGKSARRDGGILFFIVSSVPWFIFLYADIPFFSQFLENKNLTSKM